MEEIMHRLKVYAVIYAGGTYQSEAVQSSFQLG